MCVLFQCIFNRIRLFFSSPIFLYRRSAADEYVWYNGTYGARVFQSEQHKYIHINEKQCWKCCHWHTQCTYSYFNSLDYHFLCAPLSAWRKKKNNGIQSHTLTCWDGELDACNNNIWIKKSKVVTLSALRSSTDSSAREKKNDDANGTCEAFLRRN